MQEKIGIAIDGPAGAGKSTIAKKVSKHFKIVYLDTGAMYRTVALKALREGISTKDKLLLAQIVENINIIVDYIDGEQKIYLDNEDVSELIRTPEVSIGASDVAVVPEVRIKMVDIQRQIARETSVVMDGRDIGTYVLPDSKYKFYLTASIDERAKRRYSEQILKGVNNITLEDVKNDIIYRDKNDSSREFAPLSKADDAIEIDSTCLSIDEVSGKIISFIENSGR